MSVATPSAVSPDSPLPATALQVVTVVQVSTAVPQISPSSPGARMLSRSSVPPQRPR